MLLKLLLSIVDFMTFERAIISLGALTIAAALSVAYIFYKERQRRQDPYAEPFGDVTRVPKEDEGDDG